MIPERKHPQSSSSLEICAVEMMSYTCNHQKHQKHTRRLVVNDHDCDIFSHDIVYDSLEPKKYDILQKLTGFRTITTLDEFILNGLLQTKLILLWRKKWIILPEVLKHVPSEVRG